MRDGIIEGFEFSIDVRQCRHALFQFDGGFLQVANHLVNVILQNRDLATGLHFNKTRQIPPGNCRGYFGDGAHLGGQIGSKLVDVLGEVPPDAAGALHAGLAAQLPLNANLVGDPRHFVGKIRKPIHHRVDRILQLKDLPFDIHGDFPGEVAVGHSGRDSGNIAHLSGQVRGHRVH